jgi:hypothetical protein
MLMNNDFTGYHGTDKSAAVNIMETKNFHPSIEEDEWLGKGVYFFWDPDDSQWWCTDYSKLTCYVILKADLSASKIIDLVHRRRDQENFSILCNKVKNKSAKKSNGELRKNYMSLALKYMVSEIKPDIIIGGFDQNRKFWFTKEEDRRKFPLTPLQIQFCVLNRNCIGNISVYQEVG